MQRIERDSYQIKHWFLDHPEEIDQPKFRFKIFGSYRDAMSRQLKVDIRIQSRLGSLNSKEDQASGGEEYPGEEKGGKVEEEKAGRRRQVMGKLPA